MQFCDRLENEGRCAAREGKGTTLLLTVRRRLIDSLGQDTVPARLQQVETRRPPSPERRGILRFEENPMEKRAESTASIGLESNIFKMFGTRNVLIARLFTICSTGSLCHKEEFRLFGIPRLIAKNLRVSRVSLYEYALEFARTVNLTLTRRLVWKVYIYIYSDTKVTQKRT